MSVDFRATGEQRRSCVRVRQADRDGVEFLVIVVTKQLRGFDLKRPGLETHARCRYGDAVFVTKVFDGFHVGVVGQQIVGHGP